MIDSTIFDEVLKIGVSNTLTNVYFTCSKNEFWVDPLKDPEGPLLYQTLDVEPFYIGAKGANLSTLKSVYVSDVLWSS